MNHDDPREQILADALAAYQNVRVQGHRAAMIAALTAADLYDHEPEHLEPVLAAYDEDIPGASTHRGRMRAALDKALDLEQARMHQQALRDGQYISYGPVPLRQRPWPVPSAAPHVALYPSGTIVAGNLDMNRAGALELVRLLQLALRDQAAITD